MTQRDILSERRQGIFGAIDLEIYRVHGAFTDFKCTTQVFALSRLNRSWSARSKYRGKIFNTLGVKKK